MIKTYIIESFKRLYESGEVTEEKFDELLEQGNITKEQYDYILGKEENK